MGNGLPHTLYFNNKNTFLKSIFAIVLWKDNVHVTGQVIRHEQVGFLNI